MCHNINSSAPMKATFYVAPGRRFEASVYVHSSTAILFTLASPESGGEIVNALPKKLPRMQTQFNAFVTNPDFPLLNFDCYLQEESGRQRPLAAHQETKQ